MSTETYKRGLDKIESAICLVLDGMKDAFGIDPADPNFRETPQRVRRAYEEMFAGLSDTEQKISQILSSAFPCENDEMVLQTGIYVSSNCPHHLLPCLYKVSVAYIPAVGGGALGLSKLARLVELLAKRPVLQEQFTNDVTKHLMSLKGCCGAACLVQGRHLCMLCRGIKQWRASTTTSSMKGDFLEDGTTKAEFLSLAINQSGEW